MKKINLLASIFLSTVFLCSANLVLAATATILPITTPATTAIVNGTCGEVDGTTVSTIPTDNLCKTGKASVVSGPNPGFWWYCEGANGGEKVACRVNYLSAGSIKLISPTGGEKWKIGKTYAISWEYTSLKGDISINISNGKGYSCEQGIVPVESKQLAFTLGKECKYTSLQTKRTMEPGEYIITLVGHDINGKAISYGMETGNPIYISLDAGTATPIKGVCGSVNGKNITAAPLENLCSSGIASEVLGEGPWTWKCNGFNNGETASCKALGALVEDKSEMMVTSPIAGAVVAQGSKNTATWTGSIAGSTNYTVCLTGGSLGALGCKNLGTVAATQHSFTWTVPTDVTITSGYQLSFGGSTSQPVLSSSFSIGAVTTAITPTNKAPSIVTPQTKGTPTDINSISLTKPISQMTREELINILMAIVQALSKLKNTSN